MGAEDFDLDAVLTSGGSDVGGAFRYTPGDSVLHGLNPITKLVVSGALIVTGFVMPTFWGPLVLTVFLSIVCLVSGIYRQVAQVVVTIGTPLGVSLFLIHGLFNPQNETPLWVLSPVPVIDQLIFWQEGITFALVFFFRIMVLLIALLATILSTHPRELTVALTDKGMPKKLAYVFIAALQFVPEMQDRARAILDAQQARGLDIQAGLVRRLRAFVALMAPLLIGMLVSTETRALALESRGFTRPGDSTSLFVVSESPVDRVLQAGALVLVAGAAAWRLLL